MTQTKLATNTAANRTEASGQSGRVQRRAERFFYNQVVRELKDQFLEFMNDGFSARLIDEKTRRLVDDLMGSIGSVRLDKLNSVRFFMEHEDLFSDIAHLLRDLPQKDRVEVLLASTDMTRKYSIALVLRPPGAEQMSVRRLTNDPVTTSIVMDVMTRWLAYARERQKVLGDILSALDRGEGTDLEEYTRLPDTLNDITLNMGAYEELEGIIEDIMNKVLSRQDAKPVAKRWFWEKVIVQGIELINDYCHTEDCAPDCRRTHDEAPHTTAAILALIYPDHFTGSPEETAAQIRERYFQIRHPANDQDAFIKNLFSRYVDEKTETADPSRNRVV